MVAEPDIAGAKEVHHSIVLFQGVDTGGAAGKDVVLCTRFKSLTFRDVVGKGIEREIGGSDEVGFLSCAVKRKEFEGGIGVLKSVKKDSQPFAKCEGGGRRLEFNGEVADEVGSGGAFVGTQLRHWDGTSGGR